MAIASQSHDRLISDSKTIELLFYCESAFQTITISRSPKLGRCLYLDGVIQSCDIDHAVYDQALLKHLPQIQSHLLIVGGGDGFVASAALKSNPRLEVTVVDIDRVLVQACKKFLHSEAFDSPRASFVFDDALHFLRTCPNDFGHIISDLTDTPITCMNIFHDMQGYYRELFRLISQRLTHCNEMTMYLGCDRSFGELMSRSTHLEKCEFEAVDVPSYGEYCYVLHGHVVHYNKRRSIKS